MTLAPNNREIERFREIMREVADQLIEIFKKKDLEFRLMPVYSERNKPCTQTHVDFLRSELFKEDTVGIIVDRFRDKMLEVQQYPDFIGTVGMAVPRNVGFAERYCKDHLWLRGVSDYFIATDSLIFRIDIMHC